jgi:hypothetical protein
MPKNTQFLLLIFLSLVSLLTGCQWPIDVQPQPFATIQADIKPSRIGQTIKITAKVKSPYTLRPENPERQSDLVAILFEGGVDSYHDRLEWENRNNFTTPNGITQLEPLPDDPKIFQPMPVILSSDGKEGAVETTLKITGKIPYNLTIQVVFFIIPKSNPQTHNLFEYTAGREGIAFPTLQE